MSKAKKASALMNPSKGAHTSTSFHASSSKGKGKSASTLAHVSLGKQTFGSFHGSKGGSGVKSANRANIKKDNRKETSFHG